MIECGQNRNFRRNQRTFVITLVKPGNNSDNESEKILSATEEDQEDRILLENAMVTILFLNCYCPEQHGKSPLENSKCKIFWPLGAMAIQSGAKHEISEQLDHHQRRQKQFS